LGHGDRAVAVNVVITEALHKASAKGHIFWANHSSLEIRNAASFPSVRSRDFASNMSKAAGHFAFCRCRND
jgi:inosine/xanthosine triphosphate pyrophosphatase family protein